MKKRWHVNLASEIIAGYKEEGGFTKRKWILIEWYRVVIKHSPISDFNKIIIWQKGI